MAIYTQRCSKVGNFSYADNFTLYVELDDRGGNPNTNKSIVDYNVYCQSDGSGSLAANHFLYFELNGQVIKNENSYVNVKSPNAYIPIVSGSMEVEHNSDGSKGVWFSASINATGGYGLSATRSDTFWLNNIPRYTTVWVSERGRTVNSISINWSTADARDWTQYSLNNGPWINASDIVEANQKNGCYTIGNLNPNTSYKVKTRCRRQDSQLWSESEELIISTYDIAKIFKLNNFEHGSNVIVSITNPGNISNLNLTMKIEEIQILSRSVQTGDNVIVMTDVELDALYKKYGSSSVLTATFTVLGSGYSNAKDCQVILKGNQKTVKFYTSSWKRAKVLIKKNKKWKNAVIWFHESTGWKRGI